MPPYQTELISSSIVLSNLTNRLLIEDGQCLVLMGPSVLSVLRDVGTEVTEGVCWGA